MSDSTHVKPDGYKLRPFADHWSKNTDTPPEQFSRSELDALSDVEIVLWGWWRWDDEGEDIPSGYEIVVFCGGAICSIPIHDWLEELMKSEITGSSGYRMLELHAKQVNELLEKYRQPFEDECAEKDRADEIWYNAQM